MLIQDPKDEVNLISDAPSFQTFACSKVFVSARETANIFKHKMLIYIYMGSGRFPGPMELLFQQLVRVSKTR